MVYEFKFPDVGEGITEGTLVSWKVKVGDTIKQDEPIAEVENDKATVAIPSPVSGKIVDLLAKEGDTLQVGTVFVKIDEENSTNTQEKKQESDSFSQTQSQSPEPSSEPHQSSEPDSPKNAPQFTVEEVDDYREVLAMPAVKHKAKLLGIDLTKIKGSGPHGQIVESDFINAQNELLSQIQNTSMADSQSPNPNPEPQSLQPSNSQPPQSSQSQSPEPSSDSQEGEVFVERTMGISNILATPSVRIKARELGIDLTKIKGSGDNGRILESDLTNEQRGESESSTNEQNTQESNTNKQENSISSLEDPVIQALGLPESLPKEILEQKEKQISEPEQKKVEELNQQLKIDLSKGIRGIITKHMKESLNKTSQTTLSDYANVSRLVEFRNREKEKLKEKGISLTYLPFIIKAVIEAAKKYPKLNAVYTNDQTIELKKEYNISIATDTEKGLMVPVLKHCERKSIIDLAIELKEKATLARSSSLSPTDSLEGTFTITSVGSIVGEFFTPILNYPQVAILGVGRISKKPIVKDDQIIVADMVCLNLTYDHSIIDGADAARFLKEVIQVLEDPELLFLEM
jgi:pyruvate dehydrogenase E2 component (dihydrolipoamide acetyltransferase)